MKFGMPTLIELSSIEECAALCHDTGLEFVELNMNLPQFQIQNIDIDYLKHISDAYGIGYTIHLDENLNISDFNPYVSEAYVKTVSDSIALAKVLGIPVLNMHLSLGVYFTMPTEKVYLFEKYKEQYLKTIYDFRAMCEKTIGDSDIKICIENCNGYPDFQKEALGILLESDVFGLTFDIGHNHSCGGADEPYIIENKSKLFHMHLHDAIGKKHHMPLGLGELDLNGYLDLARDCDCSVVVEVKTTEGLKSSIAWMKNNGWIK